MTLELIDRKYGPLLFYAALIMVLVSTSWFWVSNMPGLAVRLSRNMFDVAKVLCCLRIALFSWRYPRYVIACFAVLSVLYVSSRLSHSTLLFKTAMLVAAARDTNMRVVLRIYLVVFLSLLVVAPLTTAIGWTSDIVKHKHNLVGHSFGLYNPNRYAFLLQMLAMLVILVFRIRRFVWIWLISWASALVVGLLTLSTTSVIVLLFFPIVYFLLKLQIPSARWQAALPFALVLLSIGLAAYFGPSKGASTFESRFSIPYLIFEGRGLSWLGQEYGLITWGQAFREGIEPLYMNNLFLRIIVQDGVIVALLVFALYAHYLYRMTLRGNRLLLAMVVCVAISGLMQLYALIITLDFLLLYYFQQSSSGSDVSKSSSEAQERRPSKD